MHLFLESSYSSEPATPIELMQIDQDNFGMFSVAEVDQLKTWIAASKN